MQVNEVKIHSDHDPTTNTETVTLWRVSGLRNSYWPTKIAAEAAARTHFPHEDCDQRYGRIYFTHFVRSAYGN